MKFRTLCARALLALAAFSLALPAFANAPGNPPLVAVPATTPVSLSVTTVTANVALPNDTTIYPTVVIVNNGPNEAFVQIGAAGCTASTSNYRGTVPANGYWAFWAGPDTNVCVAAVTASGTATLRIRQSNGAPSVGWTGGSGGAGSALASAHIFVGNAANIATDVALSGDGSLSNTGALTVGSIGGKTVTLGGALTTSGAFGLTFTLGADTNLTLPASFGAGVSTWLGTPSSANLATAVTDETGSGLLVFGTSPSLTTPTIGVAAGTSLALGGATIGSDALGVTGTGTLSGLFTAGSVNVTASTIPAQGIYLSAANTLGIAQNTALRFTLASSGFSANNASGGRFEVANSSATQPVFIPNKASPTTGIGAQASGNISSIVAGTEVGRWTSTGLNNANIGATTAGTINGTTYAANGTAGVDCAANSVTLLTEVVTKGIVTHC